MGLGFTPNLVRASCDLSGWFQFGKSIRGRMAFRFETSNLQRGVFQQNLPTAIMKHPEAANADICSTSTHDLIGLPEWTCQTDCPVRPSSSADRCGG